MKLGDNMATMDTCNVWGDVGGGPRKCRPPRIGEIPKHGAVDHELSPSSEKIAAAASSGSGSRVSALELPLRSCGPSLSRDESKSPEGFARFDREETVIERKWLTRDDKVEEEEGQVLIKLSEIGDSSQESSAESAKTSLSPEEGSEAEVVEVRKDSALFLEEQEGLSTLRDILKPCAHRYVRPRRESSGYASSVGTFDEDGRSSSCLDTLQDFSSPSVAKDPEGRRFSRRLGSKVGIARSDLEEDALPSRTRIRKDSHPADLGKDSSLRGIRVPEGISQIDLEEESLPVRNRSREGMPTSNISRNDSSASFEIPNVEKVNEAFQIDEEIPRIVNTHIISEDPSTFRSASGRDRAAVRVIRMCEQLPVHTPTETPSTTKLMETKENPRNLKKPQKSTKCVLANSEPEGVPESSGRKDLPDTSNFLEIIRGRGMRHPNQSRDLTSSSSSSSSSTTLPSPKLICSGSPEAEKVSSLPEIRKDNVDISNLIETIERVSLEGSSDQKEVASRRFVTSPESSGNESRLPEITKSPSDATKCIERICIESPADPKDQNSQAPKCIVVSLGQGEDIPQESRIQLPKLALHPEEEPPEESQESKVGRSSENSSRLLPKAIKVYQLLSTQSEDQGDGEPHLPDRRISLQISNDEDLLKEHSQGQSTSTSFARGRDEGVEKNASADTPPRKLSSPGEAEPCKRSLGVGGTGTKTVRPIYPYYPYSPYGSPQGSPRNRRRPMRESRRVSIGNRQGVLQLNQYKLLDNIGQGSYGIVKLVYNEEEQMHYAMKILSKKKLMKKAGIFGRMAPGRKGALCPLAKVYREIALLKKLDHPNVVKLVEVLDDPDEDNLYLVFELVQQGEVLQVPTDKPLDGETARKNFRDVIMGVEYLHYQRIVHRDIKPSNLLVDGEGRIKIADLGVSAELRAPGELLSGPAGTPAFAAPETTTPGAHYPGTQCDVWSLGVTLYSLVTGRIPWDGSGSIVGVQAAVRSEPLKYPEKPELSEDLRDLISKMLAKNPVERITLRDIKVHPWLTNAGKEPLPSESDNCRLPVTVTDEEVERVVTRVPKLDTLILIKTMLKQHSFQNPFVPRRTGKINNCDALPSGSVDFSSETGNDSSEQLAPLRNPKTLQFQRAGRSNSAPDSYDWHTSGRQISIESSLPPVTEASNQEIDVGRR